MVRVVMARMWQTLSTRITLTRIQMIPHRNRRIKISNANRLTRLGCVQVAQKIILFVSNSAHQAWICYIFIYVIYGFLYKQKKMKIQWKDGPTEHRRCICKQSECFWALKNKACPINTNGIVNGHNAGHISDLTMGLQGLRHIVREISLTNNGNIYVNLNL